jgi:hypothetical protein
MPLSPLPTFTCRPPFFSPCPGVVHDEFGVMGVFVSLAGKP